MTVAAQQTRFRIEGMDCASCATKIDTAVRRIPGVSDVAVSVTGGTMTVHHHADTDLSVIAKRVVGLGYEISEARKGTVYPTNAPACGCGHDHDHGGHGASDGQHDHHGHHHSLSVHEHAAHDHDSHDHGAHDHAGHDHAEDHLSPTGEQKSLWASKKARLTLASGMGLAAAWSVGQMVPNLDAWLFIAAMLVGLIPIARRAVMAALAGTPFSIEMLMTIAAVGAVLIGAAEEAATVVFLFLIGELLEGIAGSKARSSIQALTDLVPKGALLDENGRTREVPADSLAVGVTILVRPGDRIPADGIIVSGASAIDEAPITGESLPVEKGVEAAVFAGTVNGDGALRVRVTAAAADNTIARVIKLVEEAQDSKAPTERFIDRFSRYYTPAVFAIAIVVAVLPPLLFGSSWNAWIYKGLAILLIGCPCALVISTPAAIAASLSAGARRGLLLKGGAVLENLGSINMVAFDKTGTLTAGRPVVTDVVAFGRSESDVLRLAAALETGSSHPLAKAIVDRATADGLDVPVADDVRAIGGKGLSGKIDGVEVFLGSATAVADIAALDSGTSSRVAELNGEGKTISVLLQGKAVVGIIAMRDEARPDAIAGLKALADMGVQTVMLTGDNQRTAEAIGATLGIAVRAELLPQDKQRIVEDLKIQGLRVAKVGDGINDAPALAAADIGIAMGGGADVALEAADAAILHGRVGDVARMITLSRKTMANIRQNITIALGLKGLLLVTTLLGISGLWPAILADTGATVLVTLNALRLLQTRQ